ncbi:syncytin-2-like isoform X1 [Xenopus laevis]|uniref:syncytin-2-like isoform X1 n=1 Tax=Xenopus laevis TaxID=8355 RepID=A0A8J1LFY0_XENLA|nr:syncytin-2-like isoform X1 [Xenopus laevis]XP_041428449.1 syncytin-2-like isoform X1 [Xenopus laevis]XP_041428450.1 syncytin-2-like isoform X1 [Xenopus laevis]XP_041428451.1 syncytin-2-like isoform X1 [Xenopus laevis]XP_041428452.1 syncytin-2-like isoform X1 [Xenopus laevis]XP_041428453.1 syncytin-2-like isoform X1 [Xenopus laevis]XP_041428454.1 syncytin-2-like isoform X1 [Xenopus laevis]XP_041428456.1 syncytin-2-like isoform X1 [Xenopus laevis]XP_041428457.1 syncytin-2-like isoform X1 [
MFRCIVSIYTCCLMYFGYCYEESHPNLLFKMHLQLAKIANRSNCWVCSKPPPSQSIPAMAAVHALYDIRVGMRKFSPSGRSAERHLSIEFNQTFLDGNVNVSNRHDYVCWGGGCDIQEGAAIPLSIQLLRNARNHNPNDLCVSLTGPYYFLCGQAAYRVVPPNTRGSCSLVRLVPASYIADGHKDLMVQRRVSVGRRTRRELFSAGGRAWAWFPAWTGWGIELMKRLNNFSIIMDEMLNETVEAMREISSEQPQLKTLMLQEKMALDYLFASKGGFCEFIGEDCCTWVEDTGDKVQAHLDKVKVLQGQARAIAEEGWNPFKGLGGFGDMLFSIGSWLKEVGVYVLMLLCFLFLLYVTARMTYCFVNQVAKSRAEDHVMIP